MVREVTIQVRVNAEAAAAVDAKAEKAARTRSEMVRLMLKYALAKMPDNWVG